MANPFFFNQVPPNPFMQQQLLSQVPLGRGFAQNSILGTPPAGRIPVPLFNAGVIGRGRGHRGVPTLTPAFRPKLAAVPAPVENTEVLGKLSKLLPELGNPEKFITNAKVLNDLMNRGLNRQTAPNFYGALETLSVHIGKEGFNDLSMWRIFEFAFLKKHVFTAIPSHLENITKWKHEADLLMKPKGTPAPAPKLETKRPAPENPAPAKRARVVASPMKNYSIVEVGQQVEVLQEELIAAKEEIKALRDAHQREVDFLYQHLGITPPAPPTPEPEPEPEPEESEPAPAAETSTEAAEAAGSEPAETAEGEAGAEAAEGAEATEGATEETKATDEEMGESANGN